MGLKGAQLGGHFLSMSQVFVASLLANSEGSEGSDAAGSVSVKVRNLPGEELCNFQMQGETLQDLKRELSDPQGPMSKRLRTSSLNFYTRCRSIQAVGPAIAGAYFELRACDQAGGCRRLA